MRFGIVADASQTIDGLLEQARRAEAAGVSTLLLRDHVIPGPFGDQFGPLVAMTAVAMATTTLRVGSMVICNDFRPPVQLAKEIATLDQVSGGRVELGLGAGFLAEEYAPLGISFDPPGARLRRLGESVTLLKRLLAGECVTHRGTDYALDEFTSFPLSFQRPHPPIMIAGSGPRMLDLAAREANIVGFQTVTTTSGTVTIDLANYLPETLIAKIACVREVAGNRSDDIELSTTLTLSITDAPDEVARSIARQRGWHGTDATTVRSMPSMAIGSVAEIADTLRERHDRFGLHYFVVSESDLDALIPVIAALA